MGFGRQLQTPRGDRRQRLELADCHGTSAAAQRLFQRPQRVARLARINDHKTYRIESAGSKAGSVERAALAQRLIRRAPQDEAGSAGEQAGEGSAETAGRRIAGDLLQTGPRQRRQGAERQRVRPCGFHGKRKTGLEGGKIRSRCHQSLSADVHELFLLIPACQRAVKS